MFKDDDRGSSSQRRILKAPPEWNLDQRAKFFLGFVDWIFTTLDERPFTKLFDVTGATRRIACVYFACNAD